MQGLLLRNDNAWATKFVVLLQAKPGLKWLADKIRKDRKQGKI